MSRASPPTRRRITGASSTPISITSAKTGTFPALEPSRSWPTPWSPRSWKNMRLAPGGPSRPPPARTPPARRARDSIVAGVAAALALNEGGSSSRRVAHDVEFIGVAHLGSIERQQFVASGAVVQRDLHPSRCRWILGCNPGRDRAGPLRHRVLSVDKLVDAAQSVELLGQDRFGGHHRPADALLLHQSQRLDRAGGGPLF